MLDNGCGMWFGTVDFSTWIEPPLSGADSSPEGWSSDGITANGFGWVFNSVNSSKVYQYSWPASSPREQAQLIKNFSDGLYGSGKIHFHEPTTYDTNVLSARWASPSMTCDFEGESLLPGVDPIRVPSPGAALALPVTSAQYNLNDVSPVPTTFTPVVENLFTNPNLVGDGTYATVAENHFTNPNLVGDGTWAEVRRNRAIKPRATDASGGWAMAWGTGGAGEQTFYESWGSIAQPVTRSICTVVPSSGSIRMQVNLNSSDISVTPGETIRILILVGCDVPVRLAADWRLGSGWVSSANSPYATRAYDAAGWVEWEITAPAGVDNMRLFVQPNPTQVVVGTRLVTGALMVGHGDYCDGSTTDFTVDPDMRQRWLGAENASESVMEIERVAGVLPNTSAVVGASTWEGEPAVRVISLSTTTNLSYVTVKIPEPAHASGTALLTGHQKGPITGAPWIYRGQPYVVSPQYASSTKLPNSAGSMSHRITFSSLGATKLLLLPHGGLRGSGDVWYTDISLFAGNYTGGAFSGDTAPEDIEGLVQPEDFRIRWTGAVNNSTSVMEIERVRGLTASNGVAGVSSKGGVPAARLIPTGATALFASFTIPASARGGGTLIGTSHLDQTLTGVLNLPGRAQVEVPYQASASSPFTNLPGTYPQRLTYSPLTTSYRAHLRHGGTQGSGDVWWTDIGLFAGNYDGPAFSGDTGAVTVGGRHLETRWAGAVDNSVSQAGIRSIASGASVSESNSLFIPIPDGMQLNLGAFYSSTGGAGVYVMPVVRGGAASGHVIRLAELTASTPHVQSLPTAISKQPGEIGVYLWLGKTEAGQARLTIQAIHARLSQVGVLPDGPEMWMGGQGNEGVRFVGKPTYVTLNGVNGGQVEYAATLREVIS